MAALPHALRSDIARASFHALEGDPALVSGIAARIDAALASYDPQDAPELVRGIGAALHRIALPLRRPRPGPLGAVLAPRRARRFARIERMARERHLSLPARHPELAYLCCCDPDPEIRAAALAHLPPAPSPVHAALARHARTDGERECISA